MSDSSNGKRKVLVVRPEQGRKYDMGRMRSIFFADGDETANRYSISEWWLDSRTKGSGAHSHADDHIFYVLTGTLSLFIEGKKIEVCRGSYALIPGGVTHDFENHGTGECGFISINVPAGFEKMMPQLVKWFEKNPLGDVDDI